MIYFDIKLQNGRYYSLPNDVLYSIIFSVKGEKL